MAVEAGMQSSVEPRLILTQPAEHFLLQLRIHNQLALTATGHVLCIVTKPLAACRCGRFLRGPGEPPLVCCFLTSLTPWHPQGGKEQTQVSLDTCAAMLHVP